MSKEICSCGVPYAIHNTVCGWENAGIIIQEGEKSIPANMSAEEKERRWNEYDNPPNHTTTVVAPINSLNSVIVNNGISLEEKAEELWDKYSQYLGTDIDDLSGFAGQSILTQRAFKKLISELQLPGEPPKQ